MFERLGVVYTGMGRYPEAEALLQRALDTFEKAYGTSFFTNARCIEEQAELYQKMGNLAKAQALYLRALKMVEKARGPKHPDLAPIANNLGTHYFEMHNYGEAEALYQRAIGVLDKAFGPDDPDALICRKNLEILHSAVSQDPKAKGRVQKPFMIGSQAWSLFCTLIWRAPTKATGPATSQPWATPGKFMDELRIQRGVIRGRRGAAIAGAQTSYPCPGQWSRAPAVRPRPAGIASQLLPLVASAVSSRHFTSIVTLLRRPVDLNGTSQLIVAKCTSATLSYLR